MRGSWSNLKTSFYSRMTRTLGGREGSIRRKKSLTALTFGGSSRAKLSIRSFSIYFLSTSSTLTSTAICFRPRGWFGKHRKIYVYSRPDIGDYHMMTSVVCYERLEEGLYLPGPASDSAFNELYLPEIASVFRFKPTNVNDCLGSKDDLRTEIA